MTQKNKKILMVFIEPTPYILDLLEKGFYPIKDQLDIVFLAQNLTQQWDLKSRSISFDIMQSWKQTFQLLHHIFIKRRYQLLHLAGWSNPLTILLIMTARIFFIPVTVESDTQLNKNLPFWKQAVKKIVYPILFKFPNGFLPGGTRQAKYLSYYGVNDSKITNAQMTVDVEYIRKYVDDISFLKREEERLKYGALNDDVVFLFVGRLLDFKGIRELISAMKLIQDERAKLWIVGSGELMHEVQQSALSTRKIKYFGRITGDDLWKIYNAADVFVLPSHAEAWGLVVNEAMASRKPVIVTEGVGCVDDLVRHGQEGLIIQPKQVDSLCNAMYFMLENNEKRKIMAENASRHISSWILQNEANNMIFGWKKIARTEVTNYVY
ncbi:MAG: glycosyltransferase family 4 protein [Coxiellaceae bacterium]|nr:glycosyltransferase family 4 protein [Coxiellaceae bacterium]